MTYFSTTGYVPAVLPPAPVKPDETDDPPKCGDCGHCKMCCKDDKPKPAPWPGVHKLIVDLETGCHPDTQKNYLIATCLEFDPSCNKWKEECVGVYELPTLYKPPLNEDDTVNLPSFDGPFDVLNASGDTVTLYGGSAVPQDMSGSILCMNGQLCYLPGHIPFPNIPVEIQCGGAMPPPNSGVKIWIDGGIYKSENSDGQWVQDTPYGG